MPRKVKQPVARSCAECGSTFETSRETARYCSSDCGKAWNNRNTTRGGPVMQILQAWHDTRHAKPGTREAEINRYARRELTTIAGLFNKADRSRKGQSAVDYVGGLMDARVLYVDKVEG